MESYISCKARNLPDDVVFYVEYVWHRSNSVTIDFAIDFAIGRLTNDVNVLVDIENIQESSLTIDSDVRQLSRRPDYCQSFEIVLSQKHDKFSIKIDGAYYIYITSTDINSTLIMLSSIPECTAVNVPIIFKNERTDTISSTSDNSPWDIYQHNNSLYLKYDGKDDPNFSILSLNENLIYDYEETVVQNKEYEYVGLDINGPEPLFYRLIGKTFYNDSLWLCAVGACYQLPQSIKIMNIYNGYDNWMEHVNILHKDDRCVIISEMNITDDEERWNIGPRELITTIPDLNMSTTSYPPYEDDRGPLQFAFPGSWKSIHHDNYIELINNDYVAHVRIPSTLELPRAPIGICPNCRKVNG